MFDPMLIKRNWKDDTILLPIKISFWYKGDVLNSDRFQFVTKAALPLSGRVPNKGH